MATDNIMDDFFRAAIVRLHHCPNHGNVLTTQQRIALLAQRSPDFAFFSLAHYIDLHWLEEAYHRTRKDGAARVDDVTGNGVARIDIKRKV